MKKTVALVITAIMLASAFTAVAFATVPASGFELEDYGQLHYYFPEEVTMPPIADGTVRKGEYTYMLDPILPDVVEDFFDDRFFLIDSHDDTEYVNIYIAHDVDNIYLAMEIKDHYPHPDEKSSFDIGCGPDMEQFIRSRMCLNYGNGESYVIPRDGTNKDITDESYFPRYMAKYDEENEILTYEIAYSRASLAEYFGIESFDKVYFRAIAAMYDESGKVGEAWFGFQNGELVDYYTIQLYRYPHVLHFTEAPVTEAVTDAPETASEADSDEALEATPSGEESAKSETKDEIEKDTDNSPETIEEINTIGATEEKGCGASISAMGIALLISLGAAAAVIKKR